MTWVVWRQQRTLFLTLAIGLVVGVVTVLVLRAGSMADLTTRGLLGCVGKGIYECRVPAAAEFQLAWFEKMHIAAVTVLAAPLLIGVFVGAPLFAREYEHGTHALAFTQSVSRTRWMVAKFVVTAVPALTAVVVWQVVVHSWMDAVGNLGPLGLGPFYGTIFDGRSVSPVAYTLFAFTLGMLAGAVFKRTVVAMTVTLGLYVVVRAVALQTREHLLAPTRVISDEVVGAQVERGPLYVASGYLDAKGQVVADPAPLMNCVGREDAQGVVDTAACFRENGLAQRFSDVIPVEQATTLHLVEGSIFVGCAVLFVLGTAWAVRRQT
ncbi:ABC transporter permease subunit [Lentzea sp. NBRC 102530]|uniref:ABC transporter permease n=1 Tax=Lentzea sp. NBRC 102530 TaxID=3032201 RepID=UPI0024A0E966|nr:ABC transporter permease subunit [Lentzea sp. NBRC 102530]GLY50710.1 transporter [Lentzea sp. NBRC 102530]